MKTLMSITVESDVLDELRRLSAEDDRSLSNYVQRILQSHLDNVEVKK